MPDRYNKFSTYLKRRYGEKALKVSVDAGFTCPNRGCSDRREGCIFCRIDSFAKARPELTVPQQIENGIRLARERYNIHKYIVYFQASTNTAAPVSVLEPLFEQSIEFEGVVGLAISTRPDCLPPPVLELIEALSEKVDVWVEIGLQSSHDKTLTFLNRGHTYQDYLTAIGSLKRLNVRICTHLMIGLPNESRQELMATVDEMNNSATHELKLHPLLILKDTPLEQLFTRGDVRELALEEYASMIGDFIGKIRPDMVIQRLTAEAPANILLAPRWSLNKQAVLRRIDEELVKRDIRQGEFFKAIHICS
jgi:radical SAM protein (TIGR01212 family)